MRDNRRCTYDYVYLALRDGRMATRGWRFESDGIVESACALPLAAKCFRDELVVRSVFRTRDTAINSKAKNNHRPSASDQNENVSFSLDSKNIRDSHYRLLIYQLSYCAFTKPHSLRVLVVLPMKTAC